MIRKYLTLAAFCAGLLSPVAGIAQNHNLYVYKGGHDAVMRKAIASARATLPRALAVAQTSNREYSPSLSLKVAFPVAGGNENIWVDRIMRRGNSYFGDLANTPRKIEGKKIGGRVRFEEAAILDWSLMTDKGVAFGHYSTRVILDRMSEESAAHLAKILTNSPAPKSWQP